MSEPYEPRRRPVTVIVPAGAFDPNGVMPRCTTCGGLATRAGSAMYPPRTQRPASIPDRGYVAPRIPCKSGRPAARSGPVIHLIRKEAEEATNPTAQSQTPRKRPGFAYADVGGLGAFGRGRVPVVYP
jgi:hypothetical protein